MLEHISYHSEWAQVLNDEINNDDSDWFHPQGSPTSHEGEGDFDYGRMRFVNRNLNYFYFENMISHALKNDYEYNSKYPKILEFCESMRTITNETGSFGRMCIWKLQSRSFLRPHLDGWKYHHNITRYIFCISDHNDSDVLIKINNKEVPVKRGLMFNFFPAVEMHEFVNNTSRDFYFLGWDYWIPNKLNIASKVTGITKDSVIHYDDDYGGSRKQTMFMSKE